MIGKQLLIHFALLLAFSSTGLAQTQGQCKPRASRCAVNDDCCSKTCLPLEDGSPYKFCKDVVTIHQNVLLSASGQVASTDPGECLSAQGGVTSATDTFALATE